MGCELILSVLYETNTLSMPISSAKVHGGDRALDYVLVPFRYVLYEVAIPTWAYKANDKLQLFLE